MVLAHSLRDNGARAKLVALFTPDTLRQETIDELRVCEIALPMGQWRYCDGKLSSD